MPQRREQRAFPQGRLEDDAPRCRDIMMSVVEFYAAMEPDVAHDSNMQITLLCMAISLANDVLTER